MDQGIDIEVPIMKVRPQAVEPRYMTASAAGVDLTAALEEELVLSPGERSLVPTGLAMAIPAGYEGQIRPRSGLALKEGLTLVNAPGTIDADYRSEVGLIMINHGQEAVTIKPGDRIAQMIVAPVTQVKFKTVEALDETERGSGGFGHTG